MCLQWTIKLIVVTNRPKSGFSAAKKWGSLWNINLKFGIYCRERHLSRPWKGSKDNGLNCVIVGFKIFLANFITWLWRHQYISFWDLNFRKYRFFRLKLLHEGIAYGPFWWKIVSRKLSQLSEYYHYTKKYDLLYTKKYYLLFFSIVNSL